MLDQYNQLTLAFFLHEWKNHYDYKYLFLVMVLTRYDFLPKHTRIAISRNQIILYGLGDASYRIMYDDFYLVAKPYHELLKNIKNFTENKIPLFTYEFTNVMGFVYCGFLLLIYYMIALLGQRKKGRIVKNYHSNGQLKSIGRMYKDKREGEWKFYDIDGQTLIGIDNHHNGKKNGLSVDYYPNGQKKAERYFKDGVLNGQSKTYSEKGNVQTEIVWKNDIMEGQYKDYLPNGDIRSEGFLVHGKFQGPYFVYGENKRWILHFIYVNNIRKSCQTTYRENNKKLKDGPYEEHYENGNMRRKGSIKNGFPDGKWCFYYEDSGTLYKEVEFENGYAKSCWDYYPNGSIMQHRFLVKGIYDGEAEYYYPTGELKEKGKYLLELSKIIKIREAA